jgi:hypothetical protein
MIKDVITHEHSSTVVFKDCFAYVGALSHYATTSFLDSVRVAKMHPYASELLGSIMIPSRPGTPVRTHDSRLFKTV